MPPSFTQLTPSMTTLSNPRKETKGKCKHRNSFKNRNYKLLLLSHTTAGGAGGGGVGGGGGGGLGGGGGGRLLGGGGG
jgi:hypothetical protein